jgi:hypothetical protein
MDLTPAQFKKLSKGHVTGIKNHQIGKGIDIKLSRANATKALKALKTNKGFRVKLEHHEMEGSGFFDNIKKGARNVMRDVKKAVVPIIKDKLIKTIDGRLLTPEMDAQLGKLGIRKTVYDIGDAIKPIAIKTINGQGIFGKKFDRMLERSGIKKQVYKAADVFKPLVHKAIDAVGTAGQAYGIPTAPITAYAHQYLDHPEEEQARIRTMTGQGIHKPRLIVRSNSSNIIDHENANFYPPPLPTFKERQMGLSGGSLRGGRLMGGSFRN